MAFITVEDLYGEIEVILFPRPYQTASAYLGIDNAVAISGSISSREDENVKILANSLSPLILNKNFSKPSPGEELSRSVNSSQGKPQKDPSSVPKTKEPSSLSASQIFIKMESFEGNTYRRVMAICEIFFEESNAEVILYHAGQGKYHKLAGRKLRTSKVVLDALGMICGKENVILR